MQLIVLRKLVDVVLGMIHDSVMAGQMGLRKTLAGTCLCFYWYKQRESVMLWCKGCTRCAVRKTGGAQKKRAVLRKCITVESFAGIGNDISGPYTCMTMGYRGTPHESTGFSPNFMVYGICGGNSWNLVLCVWSAHYGITCRW